MKKITAKAAYDKAIAKANEEYDKAMVEATEEEKNKAFAQFCNKEREAGEECDKALKAQEKS